MKAKRDPRLADISSRHSNAAADLPMPSIAMEPPTKKKKEPPAIPYRSPFRWSNRPEWLTTFLAGMGVLLIAFMIYIASSGISATLKRNQNHQAITDVWRQLLVSNVAVSGSPTKVVDADLPSFPSIAFQAVRSPLELNRNLRLATALPGIRRIDLSPESTRFIGRGHADDSTLEILGRNFRELDSLDLSGTAITTLKPIEELKVRDLRIINSTIRPDNLSSLKYFDTVTDLWIGWYGNVQESDNIYFSDAYRGRVVDAMAEMKGLKTIHYFEMSFTKEEREQLSRFNLMQVK
ncbi:hypothetical protein SH528x_001701 [Novipirellula sp. SH528]|uniref:hypothetical protein n=1 Tax=Novipirellula sp. SH528 TaxID=3454466 RepID=UPI003FA178B3